MFFFKPINDLQTSAAPSENSLKPVSSAESLQKISDSLEAIHISVSRSQNGAENDARTQLDQLANDVKLKMPDKYKEPSEACKNDEKQYALHLLKHLTDAMEKEIIFSQVDYLLYMKINAYLNPKELSFNNCHYLCYGNNIAIKNFYNALNDILLPDSSFSIQDKAMINRITTIKFNFCRLRPDQVIEGISKTLLQNSQIETVDLNSSCPDFDMHYASFIDFSGLIAKIPNGKKITFKMNNYGSTQISGSYACGLAIAEIKSGGKLTIDIGQHYMFSHCYKPSIFTNSKNSGWEEIKSMVIEKISVYDNKITHNSVDVSEKILFETISRYKTKTISSNINNTIGSPSSPAPSTVVGSTSPVSSRETTTTDHDSGSGIAWGGHNSYWG